MTTGDHVEVRRQMSAAPDAVYRLVSDVTRMGEWSPETTSCRWLAGAVGPSVGARFRGANQSGRHRWSTTCTVVDAEAGRRFGFDVHAGPVAIARWTYEIEPDGDGCTVTEIWTDRRASWMRRLGTMLTGVGDRATHNQRTMETTLERLAEAAETAGTKA